MIKTESKSRPFQVPLKVPWTSWTDPYKTDQKRFIFHVLRTSFSRPDWTSLRPKWTCQGRPQDVLCPLGCTPKVTLMNLTFSFSSSQHLDAAEKWCSLAIKFLKYLKDLKETYEPHVSLIWLSCLKNLWSRNLYNIFRCLKLVIE